MKQRTTGAAMLGGGAAVGWIMGLSVSPVTQTVLGTLVTAVAGAVAVFAGLRHPEPAKPDAAGAPPADSARPPLRLDALPIAALLVGIALGATSGVWTRTHNLLSPSLALQVSEWSEATGLPKAQVAATLLTSHAAVTGSSAPDVPGLTTTGLYNVPAQACLEVRAAVETANFIELSKQLQAWWPSARNAIKTASPQGQPDKQLLIALATTVCS